MSEPGQEKQSQGAWRQGDFESWDGAFRALAPVVRQQSVRVAEYTRVLYTAACAAGYGGANPERARRVKGVHADVAYRCGLYHQIGKALVPKEYQVEQTGFSPEEQAVYRKYTTEGRLLAALLQERASRSLRLPWGSRAADIRRGNEPFTRNIQWLMVRESCQQHMERWDGGGWPQGLAGAAISPIAHMVGLARTLDEAVSGLKSESPFDPAFAQVLSLGGTAFDPELISILEGSREQCRQVYQKYIHYSRTLPQTVHLVDKRPDRPMGLTYRPLIPRAGEPPAAYEAVAWFSLNAGQPEERAGMDQVEDMVRRAKQTAELSFYFLYEAADALYRLTNCQIPAQAIVVNLFPSFYALPSQLKRLELLFENQPVERSRLLFTVPAATAGQGGKTVRENLQRYLRHDVALLLDGYRPELLPPEQAAQEGFAWARLDPALNGTPEGAAAIQALLAAGVRPVGAAADTAETLNWLAESGAVFSGGTMTGAMLEEDDIVREALARENGS